jgi:uncharacterized cupin superfamily protein
VKETDLASSFTERGYVAPLRLFSARESRDILARLMGHRCRPPLDWGKGWATSSLDYYALAAHDRLLDLARLLLGENVVLWGASLLARKHGALHPWHTDIESSAPDAETLSVWIGLAHTSPRSSLKLVPFSHRFGVTLQQAMQERGVERGDASDAVVADAAHARDARSGVTKLASRDGEAVLFDGRLWHGSLNLDRRGTRYAVLLQYAASTTAIRVPDLHRLAWPFHSHPLPKAPCIMVSGSDPGEVNRLVPAPAVASDQRLPALTSRVHSLRLPLEQDAAAGWKPHPLFRGATADIKAMRCHASVLDPGRQPHPPHRHEDEELLIVLDGEAELVLEDYPRSGGTFVQAAGRGSFAYYPAGFAHTIRNSSDRPVTYLMFKWVTDRREWTEVLPHHYVPFPEAQERNSYERAGGWSTQAVLDGQTKYLRHLHAHVSTLQPGAGYAPHVDAYDVAIVVMNGTVEARGEQVGRHGLLFFAAGEPHGMLNVGDRPASYLVFEFRGRHAERMPPEDSRVSRRLWRAVRDPTRVGRAVARRARRRLAAAARRLPLR